MKKNEIVGALAALLIVLAAPSVEAAFDTVIVGGRPDGDALGPQLGAGVDYGNFNSAFINASGQVGFLQLLTGVNTSSANNNGIWRWTNGSKQLIARLGSQAPGLANGINNLELLGGNIADDGSVLVLPVLAAGPGVNASTDRVRVVVPSAGSPIIAAREGSPAPGIAGAIFSASAFPNPFVFANDGQLLLNTNLTNQTGFVGVDSTNNDALFLGSPGSLQLLAREGSPAPHAGPTAVYGRISSQNFDVTGGYSVFNSNLTGDSSDTTLTLHYVANGAYSVLATTGQTIPAAPGFTIENILGSRVVVGATGRAVFEAIDNVPAGTVRALLAGVPGALDVLAIDGQTAPGTTATFRTADLAGADLRGVVQSDVTGDAAFMMPLNLGGDTTALNDQAIWINDSAGTRLAFREGSAAGALAGITIGAIQQFTMNAQQNLIVHTDLLGAGVDSTNDRALWLVKPSGDLELIVREGELFNVNPSAASDQRTISLIDLRGVGTNPIRTGIYNDSNRLLFGLQFTDSSRGLFVTTAGVPEPTSAALLAFAAAALGGFRRRRA